MTQLNKLEGFGRQRVSRAKVERGPICQKARRNPRPFRAACACQKKRVSAIQVKAARCLEVLRGGIENHNICVGANELDDAVGFYDDVGRAIENPAERWQREPQLARARPEP
jgi:hypothetical protein